MKESKPTDAVREFAERYERRIAELEEQLTKRTCKPTESERCLHGTDCPAWLCSECGELFELGTNFCSNCGAKVVDE